MQSILDPRTNFQAIQELPSLPKNRPFKLILAHCLAAQDHTGFHCHIW